MVNGIVGLALASRASQEANEWAQYAHEVEDKLDRAALSRAIWDASHKALEAVLEQINGGPLTPSQRALYKRVFLTRAQELEIEGADQFIPERFR